MVMLGIAERFRERVPDDVLESLVGCIHGGTRDAARELRQSLESGGYKRSEARDVFPHIRRAHVETRLTRLPDHFVGLQIWPRFNEVRNCHRLVQLPGVLITISAVPNPHRIVRPSKQRRLYASRAEGNVDYRQIYFVIDPLNQFCIEHPVWAALDQGLIYASVFYSAAAGNPLGIGHVGVGFPNARFTRYLERLDLTRLFPDAAIPTAVEQIQDEADVQVLLGQDVPEEVPDILRGRGGILPWV